MVLMSSDEAARRGIDHPVALRSVSPRLARTGRLVRSCSLVPGVRPDQPHGASGRGAYDEAGVGPDDLDLVECQDTDVASELLAYRDLLLCAAGEEAKLLRSGDTTLGGRIPVNPSGGLLSKGEPLGASGLGQLHELVTQLRGQAGPRRSREPGWACPTSWGPATTRRS